MAECLNKYPALRQWVGKSWWLAQRKFANRTKPISLNNEIDLSDLWSSLQETKTIQDCPFIPSCPFKVGDRIERKGSSSRMGYVVEEVVCDSDSELVYLLCKDKNGNLTPIWSLEEIKRAEVLEFKWGKYSQAVVRNLTLKG